MRKPAQACPRNRRSLDCATCRSSPLRHNCSATFPAHHNKVPAGSLDTVLRTAFMAAPMIERYVLDEQGAVRKHVAVFVNNEMIAKRNDLSQTVDR